MKTVTVCGWFFCHLPRQIALKTWRIRAPPPRATTSACVSEKYAVLGVKRHMSPASPGGPFSHSKLGSWRSQFRLLNPMRLKIRLGGALLTNFPVKVLRSECCSYSHKRTGEKWPSSMVSKEIRKLFSFDMSLTQIVPEVFASKILPRPSRKYIYRCKICVT
jgi:hypothetical protein